MIFAQTQRSTENGELKSGEQRPVCGTDPREGCTALDDEDFLYYDDADGDGYPGQNTFFFCDDEAAADLETGLKNPIAVSVYDELGLDFDCDDTDPDIHPGADNPCNGVDNDCSGLGNDENANVIGVGEDCTMPDLEGLCADGENICANNDGGWGLVCNQTVFPVTEVCDGEDNNCSGTADDVQDLGNDCDTGLLGQCKVGKMACPTTSTDPNDTDTLGRVCAQTTWPTPEMPGFDGKDNSCDGFDRYARANGTPVAVFVANGTNSQISSALNTAATSLSCRHTVYTKTGSFAVRCDVFLRPWSTFWSRHGCNRCELRLERGWPAGAR
ncbi:MAG: MopE-related protein [Bradymonadaceae bacterium]